MNQSDAFNWMDRHPNLKPFKYYAIDENISIKLINPNWIVLDTHPNGHLQIELFERGSKATQTSLF